MGASDEGDVAGSIERLAGDVTTLIRHELELAKAELADKVKTAGAGVGMLSGSALAGAFTLACMTALAIALLALVLPPWMAVLIVTLAWGITAACLAAIGKNKISEAAPFIPEETIENLKEDVTWARQRSNRSRT